MAEPSARKGSAEDPPAPTTDAAPASANTSDAATPGNGPTTETGSTEPAAQSASGSIETEATEPEATETEATETEATETEATKPTPAEPTPAEPTAAEPTAAEPTAAEPTEHEPEPAAAKQRSVPPVPVLALGGLLVVLLIGAGLLGWHQYRAAQVQDDRAAALKTARDVAGNLTTITSDNFDGQIDALSRISTNTFKEQMTGYATMFGALVKQGNMSLRGSVTSAGLEKLEGDTASALVTLSTVITSGQQPQGVPQSLGLLVSLQRDGDNWLASNVEFLR